MGPADLAEWFYGKFFAQLPPWVGYLVVCGLAAVVAGLLAAAAWDRGIEQYRSKHPRSQPAQGEAGTASNPAMPPAADPKATAMSNEKTSPGMTGPKAPANSAPNAQPASGPAQVINNAPGGIVSLNQQGGIAAGTVNIVGTPATYRVHVLEQNTRDGDLFKTVFELRLQSPHAIGQLRVGIFGKHIAKADLHPVQGGPMQIQFSSGEGTQDGLYVFHIQNASIGYTFVVHTKQPEELKVQAATG